MKNLHVTFILILLSCWETTNMISLWPVVCCCTFEWLGGKRDQGKGRSHITLLLWPFSSWAWTAWREVYLSFLRQRKSWQCKLFIKVLSMKVSGVVKKKGKCCRGETRRYLPLTGAVVVVLCPFDRRCLLSSLGFWSSFAQRQWTALPSVTRVQSTCSLFVIEWWIVLISRYFSSSDVSVLWVHRSCNLFVTDSRLPLCLQNISRLNPLGPGNL